MVGHAGEGCGGRIILGHDWEGALYRNSERRGERIREFVWKIGWEGVRVARSAVWGRAGGPEPAGGGSARMGVHVLDSREAR